MHTNPRQPLNLQASYASLTLADPLKFTRVKNIVAFGPATPWNAGEKGACGLVKASCYWTPVSGVERWPPRGVTTARSLARKSSFACSVIVNGMGAESIDAANNLGTSHPQTRPTGPLGGAALATVFPVAAGADGRQESRAGRLHLGPAGWHGLSWVP